MRTIYKTKIGNIVFNSSGDEKYPGVYVSLIKKGETLAEVLLEVDQSDPEEEPVCKIHVWDTTSDEPIIDYHGYERGESMELEEY